MKELVPARIEALQQKLGELELDAALIYDRENLIYFANTPELEGGVLCVPRTGAAELYCLAPEVAYIRDATPLRLTGYPFPAESQSTMAARWLKGLGLERPRVGFTRYFISLKDYQCLMAAVPGMVVGDIAIPCYRLRSVKAPQEIARIRAAGVALTAGMKAAVAAVRAGAPECAVLAEAECAMGKAGSQGSPFRMQVLTRARQMQLHPYASSVPLENNAPVVIHLGASVDGYVAKMCRTVFLGEAPGESLRIYEALRRAQDACLAILRPGVTCNELYEAARESVAADGYEKYWPMEHIGYGVGIRQSEFYPIIAKGNEVVLEENMAVDLLLPTICLPVAGGPRLTDTILVTAHGAEMLTDFDRAPIVR